MKKHIMIGSLICVVAVLIFLVFWGKLPSDVPIHFDSNGNANSALPKPVVVFGTPAICAILNIFSGFALMKKKIIIRSLLGFPIGIAIGYLITILTSLVWAKGYYPPCVPELISVMGNV